MCCLPLLEFLTEEIEIMGIKIRKKRSRRTAGEKKKRRLDRAAEHGKSICYCGRADCTAETTVQRLESLDEARAIWEEKMAEVQESGEEPIIAWSIWDDEPLN